MDVTQEDYPLLHALMARVIEQRGPERPIGYDLPDDYLDMIVGWEAELVAMTAEDLAALMAEDREPIDPFDRGNLDVRWFARAFFSAGLEVRG